MSTRREERQYTRIGGWKRNKGGRWGAGGRFEGACQGDRGAERGVGGGQGIQVSTPARGMKGVGELHGNLREGLGGEGYW